MKTRILITEHGDGRIEHECQKRSRLYYVEMTVTFIVMSILYFLMMCMVKQAVSIWLHVVLLPLFFIFTYFCFKAEWKTLTRQFTNISNIKEAIPAIFSTENEAKLFIDNYIFEQRGKKQKKEAENKANKVKKVTKLKYP